VVRSLYNRPVTDQRPPDSPPSDAPPSDAPHRRPLWQYLALGLAMAIPLTVLIWLVPPLLYRHTGGAGAAARLGAITTTRTAFIAATAGLVALWSVYVNTRNLQLGQHTLEVNQEANRRSLEATREGQLANRYTSAAEQLGHGKPAVRLAGVYAMARLADDWKPQRQACIDVMCAYLRMPYNPEEAEPGEREVRLTVIRLIRDHLQEDAHVSWGGRAFNFTDAIFDGGDFSGATFSGDTVTFSGATFNGGTVNFSGATFNGGTVLFLLATFSGGTVLFLLATFSGGRVDFSLATFSGGRVDFSGARFNGGRVDFSAVKDWTAPRRAYHPSPQGYGRRGATLRNGQPPPEGCKQ